MGGWKLQKEVEKGDGERERGGVCLMLGEGGGKSWWRMEISVTLKSNQGNMYHGSLQDWVVSEKNVL